MRAKIDQFNSEKKTDNTLDPKELGRYLVKKTWCRYRAKLRPPKIHYLRWNLYAFATCLMGVGGKESGWREAMKIRLPYPPQRKLVVPLGELEKLPLDIALAILWEIRLSG